MPSRWSKRFLQTTNLGVRGSNPFGRAIQINDLTRENRLSRTVPNGFSNGDFVVRTDARAAHPSGGAGFARPRRWLSSFRRRSHSRRSLDHRLRRRRFLCGRARADNAVASANVEVGTVKIKALAATVAAPLDRRTATVKVARRSMVSRTTILPTTPTGLKASALESK